MGEDDVGVFRSRWGELTIEPAASTPDRAGSRQRHIWRPSSELAGDLPAGYRLELDAVRYPDETRRFVPAGPTRPFALGASLGGFAVLSRIRPLTPEQRSSYHVMRLLIQTGPSFREHLDRRLARVSDLYASGRGRGDRHILPETLGRDAAGAGESWTPADLLAHGRAATGAPDAPPAAAIRLGLTAAARRNPLDPSAVTEAQARAVVRMALFDFDPADATLAGETRAVTQARFLRAVERHVHLDAEAFQRWLFDDLDNIVHAIAKQTNGGVRVERAEVREGLLELAFDAYTYLGDCVCLQMQAFAQALPSPLTAPERGVYAAMYYKQHFLGGLPLVLLVDRLDVLREAVLDLWDEPADERRAGVVLRMLSDYGVMVRNKRAADRDAKRRRAARAATGRPSATVTCNLEALASGPTSDPFRVIAADLRERRGAGCACPTTARWRAAVVGDPAADPVTIEDGCEDCGHLEQHAYPHSVLRSVGGSPAA